MLHLDRARLGLGRAPGALATAVAGYTVLTLIGMVVYGAEPWARYGETFWVYFSLFSRLSVFETRDRVVGRGRSSAACRGSTRCRARSRWWS